MALEKDDRVIFVMGPTGSGKSTFIADASRKGHDAINHTLVSVTSDIRVVKATHPEDKRPVVFIDTPGFDDTYTSDSDVLNAIANWLVKTYKQNIKLAGIVYLHNISANRMSGTSLMNLSMFESVCGRDAMTSVILVTTMWNEIKEETGVRREADLKATFWKDMLRNGCKTKRFNHTFDSAWDIVNNVMQNNPCKTLQLQEEMGSGGTSFSETTAHRVIEESRLRWFVDLEIAFKNIFRRK